MTAVAVASGVEGLDLSVQKPLFTHDAFGKDDFTYAVSGDGQRFSSTLPSAIRRSQSWWS
jgi:hypothetical protein